MTEQTVSSGYASDQSSNWQYDNNALGNEKGKRKTSPDQLSSGIPEVTEYHRIQDDDDDHYQPFKPKGSRPLPATPSNRNQSQTNTNSRHFSSVEASTEKFRKRKYSRPVIITVLVLLVLVGAAAIYIKVTCYRDLLCPADTEVRQCPPDCPPHACDAEIQSNYSDAGNTSCEFLLPNASAFFLQSPSNTKTLMFTIEDGANKVEEVQGLVIHLSKTDDKMTIDVEVPTVNCSTIGVHYVTVTNGQHNETYTVNVKVNPETQQCPCERTYHVGRNRNVTCTGISTDVLEVSVEFRVGSTNVSLAERIPIEEILNDGKITIEEDGKEISLIMTANDDHRTFNLEFSPVTCRHAGTYIVTFDDMTYETVLTVESNQESPKIRVDHDEQGGLISGRAGEIQCEASVGCAEAPKLYKYSKPDREFRLVDETVTEGTPSTNGMRYYVRLIVQNPEFINNTRYKCEYSYEGVTMESDIFTAQVINATYCDSLVQKPCQMIHPYDCGKFISCVPKPVEQLCSPGQHFYFEEEGDCIGICDFPNVANCQTRR